MKLQIKILQHLQQQKRMAEELKKEYAVKF